MYHKIMVPLDGSKLAENVLPHLASIVKGCSSPEVVFVRVVEPVHVPVGTPTDVGGVYTEKDAERDREKSDQYNLEVARDYLSRTVNQVRYDNARVSGDVLMGDVARNLADYAGKNKVDLIVLSTHGRSGISRLVWGSTADKILRSTCVPVLMVRAPGCGLQAVK